MQSYRALMACADICFAASSVIGRVELAETKTKPPYVIEETHFLTTYKL